MLSTITITQPTPFSKYTVYTYRSGYGPDAERHAGEHAVAAEGGDGDTGRRGASDSGRRARRRGGRAVGRATTSAQSAMESESDNEGGDYEREGGGAAYRHEGELTVAAGAGGGD